MAIQAPTYSSCRNPSGTAQVRLFPPALCHLLANAVDVQTDRFIFHNVEYSTYVDDCTHLKKFRECEKRCVHIKKSLVDSKYEQKHTPPGDEKMQNSKPSRRLRFIGTDLRPLSKFQLQVKRELDTLKNIGITVPPRAYNLITDPSNEEMFDGSMSRSETADMLIQLATI